MSNTKVCIIGNGFVGNAIYQGLKNFFVIKVHDKDRNRSMHSIEECIDSDIFFVCVPTPTDSDGKFDLSFISSVVESLPKDKIIVIKSTITPEASCKLLGLFATHRIVFNPEFLTERTAVEDFANQKRIIIGGHKSDTSELIKFYKPIFPDSHYIEADHKTVCFIKYFCNCFFACKVSLMNEFYQIANRDGIDWEVAIDGLLSSGWVNPMHTLVPGPDGNLGFGGKCFPKDIVAFSTYVKNLDIDPKIITAAWKKNLEVRKNKNWEKIPGALKSSKNKSCIQKDN